MEPPYTFEKKPERVEPPTATAEDAAQSPVGLGSRERNP